MNHLRITTAQLAQLCGVSQGTVDRALNHRPGISPRTKENILKTAAQYGYREAVGNSKTQRKGAGQIGIIVFNLNNEYFCKLITEIEAACRSLDYTTMVMFTNYDKAAEIAYIRQMYHLGVEGIVLCAATSGPEFEKYLASFDIPIVAVGNDIPSVPYIGVDDYAAMKFAVEEVLKEGYRKVVYFSPALLYEDAYAQKRRYDGFLAALAQDISYSVSTDIETIAEDYSPDTVIICSTDYYALKVYFKTKGARIIGFDNIDILEKYKIPIDSVAYSIPAIARGAVETIAGKRQGDLFLEYQLVKRE